MWGREMSYGIYDMLSESIHEKGEESLDSAKNYAYELQVFIQQVLDEIENEENGVEVEKDE